MPPLKAQLLLAESLAAYFPEMVFTDSGITVQLHRNTQMLDKAAATGLQEELKVIAAIDHRQAEIAAGRHFDAGKVPMTAWALVD